MNLTGTILKERYIIIQKAGEGGSGTLFLAKDLELSVIWAVKCIPPSRKKEARMLRKLSHPCIPRMIDYVECPDAIFLIMEYIQGISLEQRAGKKPFSYSLLLQFADKISDTLLYLHTRQPAICYADLKPQNLICTSQDRIFLVDFDSAGFSTQDARSALIEGTPGFAAPEQYQGTLLPASDFFAFGKTLLSLSTPAMRVCHPFFLLFIHRCTKKDPARRFRDIHQLKKRLTLVRRLRCLLPALVGFLLSSFLLLSGQNLTVTIPPPEDHAHPTIHVTDIPRKTPASEDIFLDRLTLCTQLYYDAPEMISSLYKERITADRSGSDPEPDPEKEAFFMALSENEKQLLALLEDCESEQQRVRIYSLLAAQERLSGHPDRGLQYDRQLILRCPQVQSIYPLYGRLLLENGQQAESLRLWEAGKANFGWSASTVFDSRIRREMTLWLGELKPEEECEKSREIK